MVKNPILAAGGRWVRATHTEVLSEYPAYTRPYHLEMPLLKESLSSLMEYPIKNDLAFCLPLGYAQQNNQGLIRFEGYCKAALFLARQMLYHWDVREQGVPIFIGVSENGLSIFREYAVHCDFPEERLVVLPNYQNHSHVWHVKYDLLGAPALDTFERRIHFDVSSWLKPRVDVRPICASVLDVWKQQGFLASLPRVLMSDWEYPWTFPVSRYTYAGFFQELARVLGTDASQEETYWNQDGVEFLQGFLFGFSAEMWRTTLPLINLIREIATSDEVILAIVAREFGWAKNHKVLGVCDAWETLFQDLRYMPAFSQESPEGEPAKYMQSWRRNHDYDYSV